MNSSPTAASKYSDARFVTTHWSVVCAAGESDTTCAQDATTSNHLEQSSETVSGREELRVAIQIARDLETTQTQMERATMKNQMKQIVGITLAGTLITLVAVAQTAREISVKTMPPSVVKTVPPAGATNVDPAIKEISFTFSKEMIDGSRSVCQISDENFPEAGAGKIHYLADKRTCVMP